MPKKQEDLSALRAEHVTTYMLGCDISKLKIDVSCVDALGTELWHNQVTNEHEAIASWLLTIQALHPGIAIECTAEATGIYHLALAEASYAVGIRCRIYNPILTKSGIAASVRGKKTDRTDALVIARIGLQGQGEYYTPEPYMTTKHGIRACEKLSKFSSSFTHYTKHLQSLLGDSLTAEMQASLQEVSNALIRARKQLTIELQKDIQTSTASELYTRLQTIPGVGPFVAASLIGEVQAMDLFPTACSITAYAGLDPRVKQSGTTLNSKGRLTKRGSHYLRRNLFIGANAARQHDPMFKAFYDKKRAEGKSYKVATCAVARKLLLVARAVWLSDTDYSLEYWKGYEKVE